MKKVIVFITSVIMLFLLTLNTVAHNSTGSNYKYHELVTHWVAHESGAHWPSYSTTLTVNCGDFTGTSFADKIEDAVNAWNNAKFNNIKIITMALDNTSGSVYFENVTKEEMRDISGSDLTWAVTYRSECVKSDLNLHHISTAADSIRIKANWERVSGKSSNDKLHIPMHELGHVIGLDDISSSASINGYLMCNEFGNSTIPTTITQQDLQGAAFILGLHTESMHELSSTKIYHNSTYHRQPCTICGAYLLEKHSYVNNRCTICGHTK